jgi:anti-sigma regulatory factor (Ser/Thr protein kinase)
MVGGRRTPAGAKTTLGGFELTRPAVPETVTAFRHRASAFAAEQGAAPNRVNDIALAVTEAVTNAVKYAYGPTRKGSVELSASGEDGWLTLRVADRGAGFGTARSDGLGLGLAMIARLCDDLKIIQEGSGTQILMRFALP